MKRANITYQGADPGQLLHEGFLLHQQDRHTDARACYEAVVRAQPRNFDALYLLGVLSAQTGDPHGARSWLAKAIKINPTRAEAHCDLGTVLQSLGQTDPALKSFERAIALDASYVPSHYNKGNLLRETGRHEEAIRSYDQATAMAPGMSEAWSNRGVSLLALRRFVAAIESFDRALDINPTVPDVFYNRGILLDDCRQYDAAMASYDQALKLLPDQGEDSLAVSIFVGRANTLMKDKRPVPGRDSYERALAIAPNTPWLLGQVMHAQMQACHWVSLAKTAATLASQIEAGNPVSNPLPVLACHDSPALQQMAARIKTRQDHRPDRRLGPLRARPPAKRIHIAYASADLMMHPVSLLTARLFELHDRERFKVHAFYYGSVHDSMTQRVATAMDHFVDCHEMTDTEVAQMARDLGIDILVDLGGHTADARLGVLAHRAAPVQVSYLGYPGTLGANYVDYVVGDDVVVPPESSSFYDEKVIHLPLFQVTDDRREFPDRAIDRQSLGLPEDAIVLCCMNQSFKITPEVFEAWVRILQAVPQCVLWILESNESMVSNLREAIARAAIEPNRLVFAGRTSITNYLARYRAADLFMDTLPYNAGTTASDALWVGLPVLTCMGKSFASRMAASLLQAIGLPELITHDLNAYVAKAIALARNPSELSALRQRLEHNRSRTPLFDTPAFTRSLESAFEVIHARHLAGLPAAAVHIKPADSPGHH